ncbi:histidinol-phosphate transaminase [bacterium]|nr:histidinol-phosphate transaminase [bacterium]PIV81437.1 MAG: histidinol-phosphate transaminase [bacterium CG17_big_fil_post_rev_8_21_14_2_50_64_8]PJA75476.1 MAG: histidinol-phosphate transaminase [bacterium CG_4_9_14_3_um_filter_65_15]
MDFKSLLRPGILATRPYSPGKPISEVKRELGLTEVVKLASNENPEGPLPAVLEAISLAAADINRYPDATCHELTARLAAHLQVQPQQLIFGNGSNEVIDILIRALVSPGENVVYSAHSFIVYQLTTTVHFECGRPVPLGSGDRHDLDAMADAVDERTKLVIVCNPNNPTGTYNTAAEFASFLAKVPENVIVAVDEAYYEYVTAEDYPQSLSLLEQNPNLVILRTFSKIHSLAGLRVGYGVGHADLVLELHKTREPFNVNSLSQVAAIACLDNWHEVEGRTRRNAEQRELVARQIEELGLEVVPSQTNFLLVRAPGKAGDWTRQLLHKGVIVRPMDAFGLGEGAMRISIGLPRENEICLAGLKEIVGQ